MDGKWTRRGEDRSSVLLLAGHVGFTPLFFPFPF
jgi:hypothetical protein